MQRSVSVFDVFELSSGSGVGVFPLTTIDTVDSEALDPTVLAGKQIFYNAADPRMSLDGYLSCATCHLKGGQDGRVWDFTDRGEGLRNTIDLRGRAGTGHGNVHWTANFDEIQDFENDVRIAFGGTGFLSESQFSATSDPLGLSKAGLSADLDALAAYVTSLTTLPDSPYRAANGLLTQSAAAGRAIFANLGCGTCHLAPGFTDGQRHDICTIQPSSGAGIGLQLAGVGFDTPTLKGVWAAAPDLHNGQAETLNDVLLNPGHGNASALSSEERALMVDYLLQIDNDGGQNPLPAQCIPAQQAGDSEGSGDGDCDGDGILDSVDNCTLIANSDQRETDSDGIGNMCDADVDGANNCVVNFLDLIVYRANFLQVGEPDTDNNGDGVTNFLDFSVFNNYFLSPPGPSRFGCN